MMGYNIQDCAKRIKDLRIKANQTQEAAAELLWISRGFLSRIETGERGCSVDLFIRISEVYDVSLDYLILGIDADGRSIKSELDALIQRMVVFRDSL